ncbi:MAG: hypothetical protein IKF90_19985 [Parasporobacterium sp.]|nr:hypothetical protein [Parasporobacterium sp.]
MLKDIIIWGFETLPVAERESWIARMVIDKNKIDCKPLAELIDVCLGKLKRIMDTRKVRIFKPEGIEVYEELEELIASSGKELVALMSAEEIFDLYFELRDRAEGENEEPGILN